MPSPPETDRAYAYFSALGVGDTYTLEKEMAISGSEASRVGEKYERREMKFVRRLSSYKVESYYDDTNPLEQHIESILDILTPKTLILQKYASEYDYRIVCVSHTYQSFGFDLPLNLQRRATNLGVRFSFDAYNMGDLHEEITALREQQKEHL